MSWAFRNDGAHVHVGSIDVQSFVPSGTESLHVRVRKADSTVPTARPTVVLGQHAVQPRLPRPTVRGAIEQLALRGAGLHAESCGGYSRAWHLAAHCVAPGPVTVSLGSACAEQGQGSVGWGHASPLQSTVPNPLIFDQRRPPAALVPEPWPLLSSMPWYYS